MEIESFELSDVIKDNLHCEIWKPKGKAKIAMLLVHGLGEHCNRYKGDFSDFFTSKGVIIYTFDLPGHGRSGGKRGHVREHGDFNKILENRLAQIKKDNPELPIFIYGHSLGGLISAAFMLECQPEVKGCILSAPVIDVNKPLPPAKALMAKVMDKVYPSMALDNGLDREMLSRDKEVVDRYNNDPLVHGLASARLGAFILDKGNFVKNNAQLLSRPTLVMVGADEAIVSKEAIHACCKGSQFCTEKIWDGMYHEIHNEKAKQDVFNFAFDWMKKQI